VGRNELQHDATEFDISTHQRRAIEAMLVAKNMTDAAKVAGVNRSTVWR
jgi:transcriptional regulator of acetoin/glycerol metabolism